MIIQGSILIHLLGSAGIVFTKLKVKSIRARQILATDYLCKTGISKQAFSSRYVEQLYIFNKKTFTF